MTRRTTSEAGPRDGGPVGGSASAGVCRATAPELGAPRPHWTLVSDPSSPAARPAWAAPCPATAMRAREDSRSDFPARSWPHHMGWARVPSTVWALDWRYPLPPQGLHISEGQTEPRGPSLDCQRDVYSRTRRHPRAGPPCLTPWTSPGKIPGVGPGPCPPSQLVGGVRVCLVNGLDTFPTVSCSLSSLPVPSSPPSPAHLPDFFPISKAGPLGTGNPHGHFSGPPASGRLPTGWEQPPAGPLLSPRGRGGCRG